MKNWGAHSKRQGIAFAAVGDFINQAASRYDASLVSLKAISIFLTLFFITCGIFFGITTGWFATQVNRAKDVLLKTSISKKRVVRAWRRVKTHVHQGSENSLKLAIIEADNILGEALRLVGYPGETLGDRLKNITSAQISNLDEIWQAHKLRNRLVHETDFHLDRNLAERALAIYEEAFRELGILDS